MAGIGNAGARENRYDLLSRVLAPLVGLFGEHGGNRAVTIQAQIETSAPDQVAIPVDISIQYPDKLRLHATVHGEEVTVWRNGQELWAAPKQRIEAAVERQDKNPKSPAADPAYRLPPFRLPIPDKEIVFLPALFEVTDAGDQTVDGTVCVALDLRLNSTLARSLKQADWSARLAVRPDGKPALLAVKSQDGPQFTARITSIEYKRSLPQETWLPAPAEAASALKISPGRYEALLRSITGGK